MRSYEAKLNSTNFIGKVTENDSMQLKFDVQHWLDAYPGCNISLAVKHIEETEAYNPAQTEVVDGWFVWIISEEDVARKGLEEVELHMTLGSTVEISPTYEVEVIRNVVGGTDVPDRVRSWFDRAVEAVEGAENARDEAIEAKDDAESAREDAITASYYAEASEDAAQAYAAQAISAQTAAETARDVTLGYKQDTLEIKAETVDVKNDAVSAKNAAVVAQTAAETAQTGAETAQTAAETAQSAAETAQAAAEAAAEEAEETLSSKMDKANPVGTGTTSFGGTNTVTGTNAFASGGGNTASNTYAHAEGYSNTASGEVSHAEGASNTASGDVSHAEGGSTIASGDYSHAEGMSNTKAEGRASHAEGSGTTASGSVSHAEGGSTIASGDCSHAEGASTNASGDYSHAEGGGTQAIGANSHAEGAGTIASKDNQHVVGQYNIADTTTTHMEIVGGGTSSARKNIRTIDTNGNEEIAGDLSINACGGANPVQVGTKLSSHDSSIATLNTSVVSLNQAIQTEATTRSNAVTALDNAKADKTALAKTDRSLDALWKINEGQTFDFEEQTETGMNVAPSGSMFMTMENVQGKSEQETTNGYQLLDWENWRPQVVNGTAVYENNGVTLSATENDCRTSSSGLASQISVSEGDVILIHWDADNNNAGGIYIFPNGTTSGMAYADNNASKQLSYTVPNGVTYITFRFGVFAAGTTIKYSNIMIEKGSTAHAWEKYTGGIPSPNPDYPQEIHSVEEINIVVKDADNVVVSERTITPPAPLNKIGTYVDVADVESGKWLYKIGRFIPSSEPRKTSSAEYGDYFSYTADVVAGSYAVSTKSDKFVGVSYANRIDNTIPWKLFNADNAVVFRTPVGVNLSPAELNEIVLSSINIYQRMNTVEQDIASADLAFLRDLENIPADHHIFVTDQDGNDVSYLLEYIISLREVN